MKFVFIPFQTDSATSSRAFLLILCSSHGIIGRSFRVRSLYVTLLVFLYFFCDLIYFYFTHRSGYKVLWWVRLFVCLWGYLQNHTRNRCQIFVHVAPDRGLVLRQGDEIQRETGSFGDFPPHWQCIMQHSSWNPYKNGWTDHHAICNDEWVWPEEQCYDPEGEAVWGKTYARPSLTPLWIQNWTGPCSGVHMIEADDWLQALDASIIGRKGGGGGVEMHTVSKVWSK